MDSLTFFDRSELVLSIQDSRKSLIKSLSVENKYRSKMKELIKHRSEVLTELVEQNYFIRDENIMDLVNGIKDEIVTHNIQQGFPKRLLVSRNPTINAACWGEGTVVINIGLIATVNSNDELAFVIAHEMAHQILDHVNNAQLEALKVMGDSRTLKEQLEKGGKLEVLKNTVYSQSKYSREKETEADILAIKLLQNTRYDWHLYNVVMDMLDSANYSLIRKAPSLEAVFDFTKYPFKDSWMAKPQSIFTKSEDDENLLFDRDSITSHPDIEKRKETLDSLYLVPKGMKFNNPIHFSSDLKYRTSLELVHSTYELEAFGLSLFLALQRLELYPGNKYLKSQVARILVDLYIARKEHTFGKFVSMNNYPEMAEEVHTFLNNLRLSEIGNIAYHYINQVDVFDKNNEEHYYLLWKISKEIGKENTMRSIVSLYSKTYPKGKYSAILKSD